jgi:hypothetical protein
MRIRFSRLLAPHWFAKADVVPLLSAQRAPAVIGAFALGEETHQSRTDRPRPVFQIAPREGRVLSTDRGTFHRRDRETFEEDCSSSTSRAGLSLTPPTRSPLDVEECFEGHCKRHGAVTRDPWLRETSAFLTRWIARAWD